MEVGGGLRIANVEKSLIFDEQMLEPGMKFPLSRLEAVYAVPFEDSQVSVIVTNTTAQPVIVNGDAIFAGTNGHHPIQSALGPYQTRVVNLPHGLVKKVSAGAVSLNHNGDKGALLAMIHLQDADRGYSETVNFTSPSGKTTERHGAGLRLGSVNNDPLRTVVAVRNIGDQVTTVTATIPYSKQNGDTGTIELPQVSLEPGEIKLLNTTNRQLRRNDFAAAGLEIKYTGAPGSVIASASSVSWSGNHVFALPMKDPQGGLSSSGGYPWFIGESTSTVVFIKNVTNEPQDFILSLIHAGGTWRLKPRLIDPQQTIAIDVKKIRDSQEKGVDGDLMPPEVISGHVSWGVRGKNAKALIGRAQMVDFENGTASTYECQCPCPPNWSGGARIRVIGVGEPISLVAGSSYSVAIESGHYECFLGVENSVPTWFPAPISETNYDSLNPNIVSFDSYTQVTALAGGTATLTASWPVYWFGRVCPNPNEECVCNAMPTTATAGAGVSVQCIYPTGETLAATGWADEFGWPTAQKWMMTLTPTTTNFAGRFVYETDPGGGSDGCHFPGSILDPEPSCCDNTMPSTWTVESGNRWGPDFVGWLPSAVNYYQLERVTRGLTMPCRATWPQRMNMTCGTLGASSNYVDNILYGEIDVTTVSSGRNGNSTRRDWP
jgi:hypothetical protein